MKPNPFSWFSGNKPKKESHLYGLDHAILNVTIPPQSMWMNLGYWKDESDLPSACSALLNQVLITANLLDPVSLPTQRRRRRLHLLDVGIGCGDQSLHLLNLASPPHPRTATGNRPRTESESEKDSTASGAPLFNSYTGLTIVPTQADLARRRIQAINNNKDRKSSSNVHINIFCADAANPSTWSTDLHETLRTSPEEDPESDPHPHPKDEGEDEDGDEDEYWLLALDTLYHFHPSRQPLLTYAFSTLHASFMAFDLVRSDTATLWERLLLRLVCWMSGTPYGNFLTADEYEALLVRTGYATESIRVRDISEHVFGGIARFLRGRDEQLKGFGMGIGKFRAARVVFNWWARSGVVRGVIVVARRDS